MSKLFFFSDADAGYIERVPVYYADEHRHNQTYDMLYRNGLALLCYPALKNKLIYSIQLCFPDKGKTLRHPKDDGKTTSRDQFIPPIAVAMAMGNYTLAAELAAKVSYRISKRYMCTPSVWFWLKFAQYRTEKYKKLFLLFSFIEHWVIPTIPLTMLICWLCNVTNRATDVQQTGMFDPLLLKVQWPSLKLLRKKEYGKFFKPLPRCAKQWVKNGLLRFSYPGFALFLTALMFWGAGCKNPLLLKYTRRRDYTNYVVRKMLGEDVVTHQAPPPMNGIRWATHFDESCDFCYRPTEAQDNLSIDFYKAIFNL